LRVLRVLRVLKDAAAPAPWFAVGGIVLAALAAAVFI